MIGDRVGSGAIMAILIVAELQDETVKVGIVRKQEFPLGNAIFSFKL